jgi:hypothetical protein
MLHLQSVRDESRRASTPKVCRLCGRQINAGDQYVRRVGVVPGRGRKTIHVHQPCLDFTIADNWDDLDWECNEPTVFAAMVDLRSPIRDTVSQTEDGNGQFEG